MRSKNHHLLLRGRWWHFKLRIPTELHDQYAGRLSKFIEEPLKTTDVKSARVLRDQRPAKYERLWTEMRIKKGRDVVGNQVLVD